MDEELTLKVIDRLNSIADECHDILNEIQVIKKLIV